MDVLTNTSNVWGKLRYHYHCSNIAQHCKQILLSISQSYQDFMTRQSSKLPIKTLNYNTMHCDKDLTENRKNFICFFVFSARNQQRLEWYRGQDFRLKKRTLQLALEYNDTFTMVCPRHSSSGLDLSHEDLTLSCSLGLCLNLLQFSLAMKRLHDN